MKQISILVLIAFIIISCTSKNKNDDMKVIPKDELIPILVDLHKLDGALSVYKIRRDYRNYDKKAFYDTILAEHNTTREQVNYSVEYYAQDVESFELIYDKVIEELSKLENPADIRRMDKERLETATSDNLWLQKDIWFLPKDGRQNQIPFSIPVKGLGKYTLSAKIRLYSDDKSVNPKMIAYFWYDDGSIEGYRDYFEVELKKTNEFEDYSISKKLSNTKVTHLNGWILYNDKTEDFSDKHAEVSDIRVEFNETRRRKLER